MTESKEVKMDIANFNLTYGKNEKPMLEHFKDFIYPAFRDEFVRKYKNSSYLFLDVHIEEDDIIGPALTGLIVHNTRVDVDTIYDEDKQKLISENKRYDSAPYSLFYIFLKNHRMVYIPNQKESPLLGTFTYTVKAALNNYRRKENKKRRETNKNAKKDEDKIDLIPNFELHVMGIPDNESIKSELEKVKKIKKFNIRFFPLNGEDNHAAGDITEKLINDMREGRKLADSNTGSVSLNSPKNKSEVANMIVGFNGTADSTLNTVYNDGSERKIKSENISLKISFSVDEKKQLYDQTDNILEIAGKIPELKKTSDTNLKIFSSVEQDIEDIIEQERIKKENESK